MSNSNDESTDPLAGAAVGETRTFEHETALHMADVVPFAYTGRDRDYEVEITDIEVVEDDREGYLDDIHIEYEVEATKHLPPRWDDCDEPRTQAERRRSRWQSAGALAAPFAGGAVSLGVVTLVTHHVMTKIGGARLETDPMSAPTLAETGGMVVLIVAIGLFLMWALQWAPGKAGVIHR